MRTVSRAFVVGWPVGHSRSPLIHGHWLAKHGIAGSYELAEVAPEDFPAFVRTLHDEGFVGGNVTVPHKVAAARLVANLEADARAFGAVNTLWLDDTGTLHGTNTDVYGFLANLDAAAPGWDSGLREAVVLGAGGAARGVVCGLLRRGVQRLHIANRSRERAETLRAEFGGRVNVTDPGTLSAALSGAGLLVNATSLGMAGKPALTIDLAPLPADAIVNDLVYVPLETQLLSAARARGLAAVDGLGMLLHQAVPGFERWFGVRPEVTETLRARVAADIEGG